MRRSLAVALVVALALSGCTSADDLAPAEDAAPAPTTTATAQAPTVPASPAPVEQPALSDLQARAQRQVRRQRKDIEALRTTLEKERAKRAAEARLAAANPLAGRTMGVYKGPREFAWEPYERASGETRETLGQIALRPKAAWFGAWIADGDIYEETRAYVENSQAGDPDALVQMAMFRMVPWEHEACSRLPSAGEQASYRRWTDEFARGIGEAHAAVILQPDGPFALCTPSTMPSDLIAYSARVLAALPNTSVYIDGGAGDWPAAAGQGGASASVDFLVRAGVADVRGVALNSTHYSPTEAEVVRGAEIVAELARRGIPGKKVVINTSNNGRGFEFGKYTGGDPDNAFTCDSPSDTRTCVSLGIPPTTDVGSDDWGLPDDVRRLAKDHVDAYLWFGRPWLYRQNYPFQLDRALAVVRSSPYL